jgi:8-oxo-dGTP pyrophosphatase MutT (NUDIX family)
MWHQGRVMQTGALPTIELPGGRLPFRLGEATVGYVRPALVPALLASGCREAAGGAVLDDGAALPGLARALGGRHGWWWRDEAFDVREVWDGPVLATIDRGALPYFGIMAEGVHLHGYVPGDGGPRLWVARRAATKRLDPGLLDHLVAGGIPAGLGPLETLAKEAEEEAGLGPALLANARFVEHVSYAIEREEGLRRDRLHVYELALPAEWRPEPRDGEVEAFELWPLPRVAEACAAGEFKFNVAPLVAAFLGRHRTG